MPKSVFARSLVLLALLITVCGVSWGLVSQPEGEVFQMTPLLCFAFIGFGLYKFAIAFDVGVTMRTGGERAEALIAAHGSAKSVRSWMIWKGAAVVSATVGALVCGSVAFG